MSGDVDAGTFSLSEVLGDPEYALTSINCGGGDLDLADPQVLVEAGSDVTCVFTNTFQANPDATVVKSTTVTEVSAPGVVPYTVEVDNTGNVALSISVVDELTNSFGTSTLALTGPTGDANDDGLLDPDETWSYTGSYTVTQADIDAGVTIVNEACIGDVDGNGTVDDDECDTAETTIDRNPDATIVKSTSLDPNEVDSDSDVIPYTVVVDNTGNVALDITVVDELTNAFGTSTLPLTGPTGDANDNGLLDPDEMWTYTGSYPVTQADIDAGVAIANQACIGDVDGNGTVDPDECSEVETPVVGTPDASVSKSTDATSYSAEGDVIDYTIAVTNEGNVSLSVADLDLTDALNGVDVSDQLAGPFSDEAGTVPAAEPLAPGGTWYFTYSYTIQAGDLTDGASVTNSACVDADGDGTPSCSDVETPLAAFTIDKSVTSVTGGTAGGGANTAGDVINYAVVVTNTGATDLAPLVSDELTNAFGPANYSLVGPTESVVPADGVLEPGEFWSYTLQYEVSQADLDSDLDAILNEACASNADPLLPQLCDDVSTPLVRNPDATVTKTTTVTEVSAPGEIPYTIVVDNTGNQTLDISVVDELTNSFGTSTLGLDGPSGDTDDDGLLDPDEMWTYTGSYTVTQADIDAGVTIVNEACIGDVDGNGTVDDDECDTAETTIDQNPDATVMKSTTVTEVSAPGEVPYTVEVDNTGNVALSISVVDELTNSFGTSTLDLDGPSGDTNDNGLLDVDETWTYTGSYTVTQDDIDAGVTIVNEACIGDVDGNGTVDDDECDTAETTIDRNPDASVAKSTEATFYSAVGDEIDYLIAVTNTGNTSLSETDLNLTDVVNGVDVSGLVNGPFLDPEGTEPATEDLEPTGVWYFTYTYTIQESDLADGASVTNSACVDADGDGTPSCDEVDTPLAAFTILKTTSLDPNEVDSDSDVIPYTVVVTNTGATNLSPSVTDEVTSAAGVNPLTLSGPTESVEPADGVLTPGETWTYTTSYPVTQDDIDAGNNIVNEACASNDDPALPEQCSQVTTPVVQNPDATVSKSTDSEFYSAEGDVIDYTIAVTNTGNTSLSVADLDLTDALNGVDVSLSLAGPFSDEAGTVPAAEPLAPSGTWYFTYSYTIQESDLTDGASVTNVACVNADGDETPTCDEVETPLAAFTIDKSVTSVTGGTAGGGANTAGDVINYAVVVTNTGATDLAPLVSDELTNAFGPANYSLVGPTESVVPADGVLEPGEFWSYTLQYEVSQADLDSDLDAILNEACASNADPLLPQLCDDVSTPLVRNPNADVAKSTSTEYYSAVGDEIDYTITVTNTGNVSLAVGDLALTDELNGANVIGFVEGPFLDPEGTEPATDPLAPGDMWYFTYTYTIQESDLADGASVTNVACVNADGDADLTCDQVNTPLAAFTILKTTSLDPNEVDSDSDVIPYTVVVTNTGATNLSPSVSDEITQSGSSQSLTLSGPTESINTDGVLAPGETWTYTVSYPVTQDDIDDGGDLVNEACALNVDPALPEQCSEVTTPVIQNPDAAVTKSTDTEYYTAAGEEIDYLIGVTNTGNVSLSVADLALQDFLNAVDVTADLEGPFTDADGTIPAVGPLAPGDVWYFTYTYTIQESDLAEGADVENLVCVNADGEAPPECAGVETPLAAFTIDKTTSLSPNEVSAPGEIPYSIVITNTGSIRLTPDVTDELTNSFGTSDLTLSGPTESLLDDGELAPGETWTYTASYPVTQDDIDAGVTLVNRACASDDDPALPEQCDEVETPVIQTPDATVEKSTSLDPNEVAAPGAIPYTVVVTNTGNVTLDPTVVDELTNPFGTSGLTLTLVSGDTDDDGRLDVDEVWTYSGSYTVTQDDIDAGGSILNQACIGDVDGNGTVDDDECDDVETPIIQTPDATVEKTTSLDPNEVDAPGAIPYTVVVTNTGNVTLDPTVVDELTNPFGTSGLTLTLVSGDTDDDGRLDVDEVWTYSGSYSVTQEDLDAGGNIVNEACIGDIDGNGTVDDDECDDVETPIIQTPDATVEKTTSLDPNEVDSDTDVIPYTVVVTNTGNVTLDPTVVDELTNPFGTSGLTLTGPTGDTDDDGFLDVDEVWTYSGSYSVTQEDLDAGGNIVNEACIGDIDLSGAVDGDECADVTTPIIQAPAHTFTKAFAEDPVGAGETSSFTLVYTNTGNVTLSDIEITDNVDSILGVTAVTSADATCDDPDDNPQTVTCSVGTLAPGDSVEIVVTYKALPLVDDLVPDTGQISGANYVFYFATGYVLYGSTGDGTATLIDPDGNVTVADVEGRNQDIYFNAPVGGDGFELHLSCSEVFIDGYGDAGPTLEDDPEWEILAYQVYRFNSQGFFKDCGQIFAPFQVDNLAQAEATPAGGTLIPNPITAEDSVEIINIAPIEISRNRVRRGDVEVQYFNTSQDEITLDIIRVEWDEPGVTLESASYLDGIDLGLSGGSPQQASINTVMDGREKDWLKLSFSSNDAPEGLTITVVTSTGATLTYVYP